MMIPQAVTMKFDPILLANDILSAVLGYMLSEPTDPILSKFGILISIFDISQDARDEIVKIAAGIVLSAASRVLVAYSDTWAKKIKERISKRRTKKSK